MTRTSFRYGRRAVIAKAVGLFFLGTAPLIAQEPVEIVALGDSLTQGYGLIEAEGFVPQLQRWLDENGVAAKLINAGVSGDTTAGGLSRVGWSLSESTGAMVVALGGNDLLRGLPPEMSKANLEGILKVAQARGVKVLLVGMQAPGNYGPDFKQAFDGMYPDLAEAYDVALAPSFFEGLETEGDTLAAIADFMQGDGIHPNAEGVKRIVAALGPRVAALVQD